MTISVLQEASFEASASAASIACTFASNLTPGSSIHAIWTGRNSTTAPTSATAADGTNGSYGASLDFIGSFGGGFNAGAHFKFDGNTSSGKPTVTITPNEACTYQGIIIREIGNTSGYDTHKSGDVTNPGTGANAVTAGTATPSAAPGLISAFIYDLTSSTVPTIGTGFTAQNSGFSMALTAGTLTEQLRYTALTAVGATATTTAGTDEHLVLSAYFKETVVASGSHGGQLYSGVGN